MSTSFERFLGSCSSSLRSRRSNLNHCPSSTSTCGDGFVSSKLGVRGGLVARRTGRCTLMALRRADRRFLKGSSLDGTIGVSASGNRIRIAIRNFTVHPRSAITLRRFKRTNSSRRYKCLLLVIGGVSRPISSSCSNRVEFSRVKAVSSRRNIRHADSSSSLGCPKCRYNNNTTFNMCPRSSMRVNRAGHVDVPCIIGGSAGAIQIRVGSSSFLVLPMKE